MRPCRSVKGGCVSLQDLGKADDGVEWVRTMADARQKLALALLVVSGSPLGLLACSYKWDSVMSRQ